MLRSILLAGLVLSLNSAGSFAQGAPVTFVAQDCPVSHFSFTYLYAAGAVRFKDESAVEGSPIVKWLWSFGDGKTSTEQNPEHFFSSEGTYTVTLTVTAENGCSNENSLPVTWKYP